MQEAYDEVSGDIAILALSTEPSDTNDAIIAMKEELGLTTLPMGRDVGVSQHFAFQGIPTSVLVDRNGIVCFQESGAITNKDKFLRLFAPFTAEDYSAPVLLETIPQPVPTGNVSTAEEMSAALGIKDEKIKVNVESDPMKWSFVVADDAASVKAANIGVEGTNAYFDVVVTAEAGQALAYDYLANIPAVLDNLTVSVNDTPRYVYGGETEWATDCVIFEQAGEYKVTFSYGCMQAFNVGGAANLRNVRIISADEAATIKGAKPAIPAKTLEGEKATIEMIKGAAKPVTFINWPDEEPLVLDVLQDDLITLRIKLGADIDDNQAFLVYNNNCLLFNALERDGEGYLLEYVANEPSQTYGNTLAVFPSVNDLTAAPLCSYRWYNYESELTEMIEAGKAFMAQNGQDGSAIDWQYTDGSPKADVAEPAPAEIANGEGQYAITVVDEAGNPVPGVMIQICDATTCQVVPTDAEGRLIHTGAPYAYEFHVLSVPAEFARDAETYKLPEEGGSLTITLKKTVTGFGRRRVLLVSVYCVSTLPVSGSRGIRP